MTFILEIPYKLIPGNVNYELTYSITGILEYLELVADSSLPDSQKNLSERFKICEAFKQFANHEEKLCKLLLDYLNSKSPIVKIIGSKSWNQNVRVPTVSFTVSNMSSQSVVEAMDKFNIGIRFGHFYAYRLIKSLGMDLSQGVVRISLVHYNTIEEVHDLISKLDQIINH